MKSHDVDLMQHADGELENEQEQEIDELLRDPAARAKVEALGELGELVRGHLELEADAVPGKRFDNLWREIDKAITREAERPAAAAARPEPEPAREAEGTGVWRRISRWLDQYRGHIITGVVSAGAVATLALVLRGGPKNRAGSTDHGTISPIPAAYHPTDPTEIEDLDTPGGTGTVFHMKDDDGSTTVIWVTPEDTVEGI